MKMNKLTMKELKQLYGDFLNDNRGYGGIAITGHAFFEWVYLNIDKIDMKLLHAIMTNIVPLGDNGRLFFLRTVMKRKASFAEFMNIYESLLKMFEEGIIKPCTYSELYSLGYKGLSYGGPCPVDDVLESHHVVEKDGRCELVRTNQTEE
jgi:hypothetical protein